jgi:site-specific DNA-methyltransferase (adenine-specific)
VSDDVDRDVGESGYNPDADERRSKRAAKPLPPPWDELAEKEARSLEETEAFGRHEIIGDETHESITDQVAGGNDPTDQPQWSDISRDVRAHPAIPPEQAGQASESPKDRRESKRHQERVHRGAAGVAALAEILDVLRGDRQWCVITGDARALLPLVPAHSVHHVITDPPYSAEVHARSIRRTYLPDTAAKPCRKSRKHEFGFAHLTPELQTFLCTEAARVSLYWSLFFSDVESAHSWRLATAAAGLDFVKYAFWLKERGMPQISGDRPASWVEQITLAHQPGGKSWNGGGDGNVWRSWSADDREPAYDVPVVVNHPSDDTLRVHTAQKPIELMMRLVAAFTRPGDVIIDPLSGSGTTAVAALRLGRRCVCFEQLPDYAAISAERLEAESRDSTLLAQRGGQLALA